MFFLFFGSLFCAMYFPCTELSVDGRKQDEKGHDGQSAAGPVTEEHHRASQGDVQVHAAAQDDTVPDEDGNISLLEYGQKTFYRDLPVLVSPKT